MSINRITKRPYRVLSDFGAVYRFLTDTYSDKELNGMMLPQFFEYAHTHPLFNKNLTHRMTLWEDEGCIIAFCGYEMDIGEAFLVTNKKYDNLLPEMLRQAEAELSTKKDGKCSLAVYVTEAQSNRIDLLLQNGYIKTYTEPVRIYDYKNGFPKLILPDGYSCISLENGIDLRKLNRCTWRGFDHGDDVEYNIDEVRYMASGPHYRPDLGRIIIAPDGEYACFAGMWIDETNKYAYLEPLCTQPEYRRIGLARYALTDAMRQTHNLGAEYCFGGVIDFYTAIGFETITNRQVWKREWNEF